MSSDWRILFRKARVLHLSTITSNHVPIMLHLSLDHPKTPRPFRFFEAWTHDLSCEQVVREAWHPRLNPGQNLSITAKLRATSKALSVWNRDIFCHGETNISKIKGQISYLNSLDPSVDNLDKVNLLQRELEEWLVRSENIRRQKSRELWFSAGDPKFKVLSCLDHYE